jgi:uncharacterized membrane protein
MAGTRAAWALSLAFGLSLGVTRAVSFDFHPDTFAPLIAFTALWALAAKRQLLFAALALALLLLKEDMVLLTFALCWLAWVAFDSGRLALRVAAPALVGAVVVNAVVLPHFRHGLSAPLTERYGYLGDSFGEIALHAVTRPGDVLGHLAYGPGIGGALLVLAGVLFLPLLAPRLWPALVPILLVPMLSELQEQRTFHLHYMVVPAAAATLVAAVVLRDGQLPALIERTSKLLNRVAWATPERRQVVGLVGAAALVFLVFSPMPPSLSTHWGRFRVGDHARAASDVVALVPARVPVSAQTGLVPHLSGRREVYEFPRLHNAEYVVVDAKGQKSRESAGSGYDVCLQHLGVIGFELVAERDGVALWRRVREVVFLDLPPACRQAPSAPANAALFP